MNNVIQYIFFFLIGTTVLNFAIALAARLKTQNKEFNQLIFYWTSLFITYGAVAALNDNPTQIGFAYFFQFLPAFIKTKVLRDSRGIQSNWKMFASVQVVGMILSAFMLTQTDLGFTISLLPITFSTTLPYWQPVWNSLVSHRQEANWIEKGLSWVLFTSVINHFNYAFFRLDESAAWWGWSVSIAQYQCISIFLPLLINHRREVKERKNIQTAVEKISGHNTETQGTDELYQQLEIAISQKELFQTELQGTNAKLTEEREMNEILIRTISHDLANPLTVIGAYIEMLHAQKIPEAEKDKTWKRLKSNTQSALDMISRIRNAILTRSQASLVKIHNVSTDRSIHRLIELFEEKLKAKNITLNYVNHISLDTLVRAEDSSLVEHIFSNVLSNAIKFSHVGGKINISVFETRDHVQVEFRDFGTGIQESRLKQRILISTPGTNGETGTGFGMMVMGYFLRQFGGKLDIKSETQGSEQGTSATVTLLKSQTVNTRLTGHAPTPLFETAGG